MSEASAGDQLAQVTSRLREIASSLRDPGIDEEKVGDLAQEAADLAAKADAIVDEALRAASREGVPDEREAEAED